MEKSRWSFFAPSQKYSLLSNSSAPASSSEDLNDSIQQKENAPILQKATTRFIKLLLLANVLFLGFNTVYLILITRGHPMSQAAQSCHYPNFDHSPARESIKYEPKVLDNSLFVKNVYKGNPNPELDEAWEDLVNDMNTRVSKETLDTINRTSIPLQDGSGEYWVNFNVFHNLHCLKTIRQYMAKDHYPDMEFAFRQREGHVYPNHIDHCIDTIRQYIMCNVDISMVTYGWDPQERHGIPVPNFVAQHQCVDYGKFSQWAKEHRFSMHGSILSHPEFGPPFPTNDSDTSS